MIIARHTNEHHAINEAKTLAQKHNIIVYVTRIGWRYVLESMKRDITTAQLPKLGYADPLGWHWENAK